MSDTLRTWLSEAIDQRGWSHGELARRAGISRALVSRTLSGDIKPSADFCIKVAHAFEEPPEKLLRLAEILPSPPVSENSTLQELLELAQNLPEEDRQEVLKYARFRYQQKQEKKFRGE